MWRRDGRELFFVDETGHLQAAPVGAASDGTLTVGRSIGIAVPVFGHGHWGTEYDVSPDGRTIYFLSGAGSEQPPTAVSMLSNWGALAR